MTRRASSGPTRRVVGAAVVAGAFLLTGCGGSDGADSDAASAVEVADAFLGETPEGKAAALYLTIEQRGGDDRLVGVTTDVSEIVGTMPATLDMDDAMTDRSIGSDLPAGSTLVFAPGRDHLMVIDVARGLAPGDTVEVTLQFERHAPVTVEAETLSLLDINERAADQIEAEGE